MRLSYCFLTLFLAGCAHLPWALPAGRGCPSSFPVKGNMTSGYYHVPGDTYYDLVRNDVRCFRSPKDAERSGLKPANPKMRSSYRAVTAREETDGTRRSGLRHALLQR
jgi:hypothetical protein